MKLGVFDSGYGGLTILKNIRAALPHYDYIYLGDNARAPYGPRSFDVIYQYTLQAVRALFEKDCQLVILACNTASAKALRTIQQCDLPRIAPERRVLGVIRPTVEAVPQLTKTAHIGILATQGTVSSRSYQLELKNIAPDISVTALPCPMWVPLVEYGATETPGADYFVSERIETLLAKDPLIDTIVLGCTHYPLLLPTIRRHVPKNIRVIEQGTLVAASLANYLQRHAEQADKLSQEGTCRYFTTEQPENFATAAVNFIGAEQPQAFQIELG